MNLILDIARGIAALGVFLFHISDGLRESMPAMASIFRFGSLGVPLFFVISGYVISASADAILRKNESANAFLKRRFLRIYPPFWCSILVVLALPYLIAAISMLKSGVYEAPLPQFQVLTGGEWLQLISLAKVFLADNGDLQGQFSQVNSVYWTLAIEFQFYLLVYLALLFRRHFLLIVATVTAASLVLLAYPQALNSGLFLYFWPMFALGIGLFHAIKHDCKIDSLAVSALAVALLLGTLLSLAYLGTLTDVLGEIFPSASLGFATLCALILWLGQPIGLQLEAAKNHGLRPVRWLIKGAAFLGVISYSVYLLHGKLFELPAMVARQLVPMTNPLNALLTILGTLALCAVFYMYCEKPFLSKKLQKLNEKTLGN